MDIHKPKPWRGVREFLKEYLIIVVGVLTALAAEQAVEWGREQSDLREARAALHEEVVRDATGLRIAAQEDHCFLGVMDRYEAWAKGGPKPKVAKVTMFPVPEEAVWDSLKGGAVMKMPLKERLAYTRFYYGAANTRSLYYPMRDHAITLNSYLAWDTLTPAEARILLRDVQRGRNLLHVMIENAPFDLKDAEAVGARPQAFTPHTRTILAEECGLAGAPVGDKGP
jgi:hypothetical protein